MFAILRTLRFSLFISSSFSSSFSGETVGGGSNDILLEVHHIVECELRFRISETENGEKRKKSGVYTILFWGLDL